MYNRRDFIKIAGAGTLMAATGYAQICTPKKTGPIKLRKLGTFDLYIVEANPVVFKGKLYLFEYIRYENPNKRYRFNETGNSYFRFLDMSDMKSFTPAFGHGLHMGNAFVAGDKVIVTAVENWGKSKFYQMESTDLVNWTKPQVILEDPAWEGFNTTMCKADDRYILSFELGKPKELVGRAFTMFFAESRDLKNWKFIEGASMGKDRYTGGPMLRYFDGWFYYFHVEYNHGFVTRVARSRDLKNWEFSPHVVLGYDQNDKKIHHAPTVKFTESELALIAGSNNINASDFDMCELNGKLVGFYSWGNQRGCEFSALAEADCTEKQFCESFFDRNNFNARELNDEKTTR